MPPTPGLRGWGTSPDSPAGFLGSSGWGKCPPLLSCSSGPRGPFPPASPVLPSASFLCPQDQCGWGEGGSWRAGDGLGTQQAPWAQVGGGQTPSSLLLLLLEGPSHPHLLMSPASEAPILSGLHFSSHLCPPTSYWFTWGFLPSPWVSVSPTSSRQVP